MENPITIVGVKVDRFQRLTAARVEVGPEGGLIRITGPNKAGKTSLLRAIAANIGGGKEVPSDPLHEDSETGAITLKLSNGFTIERRFTNTASGLKGYLKAVGPDGKEMKQTALNDWLGSWAFDPLHFFNLDKNEKRSMLLGLDPGVAEKLVKIDNDMETLKTKRLPFNSTIQKINRMDAPDGLRPEKVDVTAEMEKLAELEDLQAEFNKVTADLSVASGSVTTHENNIEKFKQQIEDEEGLLRAAQNNLNEIRAKAGKQMPATVDIEELKLKISGADAINEKLIPWEVHDRALEEFVDAREQSESYTSKIATLDQDKKNLLSELSIGVDGLGFDPAGNPTLNGHPMEQASGGERVKVATQVAIAYNPQLRICLIDEANDLDTYALEELDALAREHGFQLWVCRIDEGNPGEVVVDNGQAWTEGQK